jgi:hypothetical protein
MPESDAPIPMPGADPGGSPVTEQGQVIDRGEALKFLGDTYIYYGRYHDHKETSAWLAVALWLTAMSAVIVKEDQMGSGGRIGLGLLIMVLGGCFIWYVFMQLRQRSHAADVVAAAISLSASIIGKKRELTLVDLEVGLPKYNQDKDSHCFPACLLEAIRDMRGKEPHVRKVLGGLAYAFLIISFVAAMVKLAWPWVCAVINSLCC